MTRSMRLTTSFRDNVRRELLSTPAQKLLRDAIHGELHALLLQAYQEAYGPHLEAMKLMPGWMFERSSTIHVNFDGRHEHHSFKGQEFLQLSHGRYMEAGKQLCAKYKDWKVRRDRYENDQRNLSSRIRANLMAVTTYKRLIETWPEIEPIARKYYVGEERVGTAISYPVKELNEMLGLGKKDPQ